MFHIFSETFLMPENYDQKLSCFVKAIHQTLDSLEMNFIFELALRTTGEVRSFTATDNSRIIGRSAQNVTQVK